MDPTSDHSRQKDPSLNLGCGDVSPDGRSIVLEAFTADRSQNGIYLVRASDGGGLRVVSESAPGESIGDPIFSPDGTRIAFFRTKAGVSPQGAGAIFVVDVDGSNLRRITPWGGAFLDQSWSAEGQWIIYQRPCGVLRMVHPDGSEPHDVPLTLPLGSGAQNPSWSPDGRMDRLQPHARRHREHLHGAAGRYVAHERDHSARCR
jgi:TolB protein